MITVVSMNPCIDLTLFIPKLTIGGSHRVTRTRSDYSGKAVNVAHCLKNLQQPVKLLGFNFAENGRFLAESLDNAGISHDFINVVGSIRTNTKIFEESTGEMTEINQESAAVSASELAALTEKLQNQAATAMILSGSLPTGAKPSTYADIIRQAKIPVILDTYGQPLIDGLAAGAYLIKPNLQELEQTLQQKLPTQAEQIAAAQKLLREYPKTKAICLSLGAKGAFMIGENAVFFAPPLDIPIKGVQGAGDSLVAGLCVVLANLVNAKNAKNAENGENLDNPPLSEMLKSAVAAACASLMQDGSLMAAFADYENMLPKVVVEKMN
ncbi:MAG: 1-phosphofructokinase family hexose kinase [Defluviitaleaceae bacterium]|nr:1-phosphofructokinase family hexose kinase [Defluviitaleaceae bacterium]